MSDTNGFSCEVTGFEGFQHEILRLRNANRERAETLDYLAWRYRSTADAPEPRVFWLLSSGGERVGMAAVVFRPYRISGERVLTAVVGDISLDARLRGRGLGGVLLRYMTEYLDQHFPAQPAFVIPTESARRSLASVGWVAPGRLVPYVCVLDARRHMQTLIPSARVAKRIAGWLATAVRMFARWRAPRDGALFCNDALDNTYLEFVNSLPRHGAVVHDSGLESLTWRYAQHPHMRFNFARYYRSAEVCGFAVFEDDPITQACSVYDLWSRTPADASSMLVLLVLRGLSSGLSSVRMVVNDQHPLRQRLRRLGFIARSADSVFQVHSRTGNAECAAWCVTHGDKDI